jgi:hypothetical protein|tara:strand:+ start:30081 stop:30347 length:267 start_codon:yes stop_codon:yes gene_type:complete
MTFNLAKTVSPGKGRLWSITHQPRKQTKPVRLELRQRTIDANHKHAPLSFTRLLGSIDTIADETSLVEAAKDLLTRVGKVDDLIGVYE